MNNLFEDLRITLGNYRNADFTNFNILRNLSNFLNSWVNQFRGMMPYNFTIPGNWNVNLNLEDIIYRLSNSQLFEHFHYPDIVRWILVLITHIDSRLRGLDNEYVPNPPLLWRQNAEMVREL
jgi:hypothetical protein